MTSTNEKPPFLKILGITTIFLVIIWGIGWVVYISSRDFMNMSCSGSYFYDGMTSWPDKLNGADRKLTGFSVYLSTKYEAELTDVVIKIILPEEVALKPPRIIDTGEIFDYSNRIVTRHIDKILRNSAYEGTACAIEYSTENFSKPIEIHKKVYFKQTVVCKYLEQNKSEGVYTKKDFFFVKNGELIRTSDSDTDWKFAGKTPLSAPVK